MPGGATFQRGLCFAPETAESVTAIIQRLAPLARVDQDKCNPRCLRKLYMATMENMRQNVEILLRMTYDNLLEQEQTACGWEDVQRRG